MSDILDPRPVAGVPPAYVRSQGGLFDVLPHPRFEENGLLYLSLAHGTPDANATRVVRGRFDGTSLTDVETVFTVEPTKDTPVHYGGRMLFLPDGTLLLTTGDGFVYREESQRLGSLLGKVLRLNDDGTAPDDNPFVQDPAARDEIWTFGHRNPQGIAYDRRQRHRLPPRPRRPGRRRTERHRPRQQLRLAHRHPRHRLHRRPHLAVPGVSRHDSRP